MTPASAQTALAVLEWPEPSPRPGPRRAVFLVTVRDACPVVGGNPSVTGREAGRPWKLAAADACRCCHQDRRIPAGAWQAGGAPGLASKGQAARCRLDRDQLAELDRVPDAGPAAAGWEDQRWTLVRVRT